MIHNRTAASISLATACGYFGGYLAGGKGGILWMAVGLVVTMAFGGLAMWYTPDPEEIAVTWIEHKEMTENGGNADQ